jgi:hypothetical protein
MGRELMNSVLESAHCLANRPRQALRATSPDRHKCPELEDRREGGRLPESRLFRSQPEESQEPSSFHSNLHPLAAARRRIRPPTCYASNRAS